MTMLRLHDAAGTVIGTLPSWLGDPAAQEELNETGSLAFDYPRTGKNAQLLLDTVDAQVSVVLDNAEVFRALVEDDGDDLVDDKGAKRPLSVSGRGTLAILERAVTLPQGGVGTVPAQWSFASATPGKILTDLISAVQALGFLTNVTLDFDAATDSDGQPWAHTITVRYDAGLDLLQVATALCAQGVCDVRMVGLTLKLYNPQTVLGVDRPTVMVRRRHLLMLPRKRSRRDLRSDVLAVGQDGLNLLRTDATAQAKYGARLGYLSQGNTTDSGTLAALGDNFLAQHARPSEGWELPLQLSAKGCPQPWTDFGIGDFVRCDQVRTEAGDAFEPLRVRAIAYAVTAEGLRTATLTCNDLFLEATIKLKRRIDGIDNGYIADTGGVPVGGVPDVIAPNEPTGLGLQSDAFVDDTGTVLAQISATWSAPTTNTDGSPCQDIDHYVVRWSYQIDGNVHELTSTLEAASWSPLSPGALVDVQVAAVDTAGNISAFTIPQSIGTATDTVPPPVPSAPVVTPYLGQLRVTWDGLGSVGEVMPTDFARVEVHVDTSAGFTPSAATLRGAIEAQGGDWIVTGLTYDTTYYVALVAVDRTGNPSSASVEDSGVPVRVTTLDVEALAIETANLGDLAVTSAKMADLSVITAKIADLAVDDAKIANVDAGKITTGFLDAARIEAGSIDATHLSATAIDGKTITGSTLRTAASGMRWEILPVGSDGEIQFYGNTMSGGVLPARLFGFDASSVSPALSFPALSLESAWGTGFPGDANNRPGYLWIRPDMLGMGVNGVQCFEADSGGVQVGNGGTVLLNGDTVVMTVPDLQFLHSTSSNPVIGNQSANIGLQFNNAGYMQVTGNIGSTYMEIRASKFTVSSDRKFKRSIREVPSVLDQVRAAKVYEYARDDENSPRSRGLMSDEVPDIARAAAGPGDDLGDGVDVYGLVATLWRAVQELDAKITA